MTNEHKQQTTKINNLEWLRLFLASVVYVAALVWQISELKTEFRVRIAQLETQVKAYQELNAKSSADLGNLGIFTQNINGRLIRVEDRLHINLR